MKERPILFSGTMIRAILDGTKTQTRRVVKPQPETIRDPFPTTPETMMADGYSCNRVFKITERPGVYRCLGMRNFVEEFSPYGQLGDRLWVRETFCPIYPQDPTYNNGEPIEYDYRATYRHGDRLGDSLGIKKIWKPSIFMPRKASRITLGITGVRVERLQDINEADAKAEGAPRELHQLDSVRLGAEATYRSGFEHIWCGINGQESWDANPWVWVVEFKRLTDR